nr:hypothetical protein [Streptomyces sp. CS131]
MPEAGESVVTLVRWLGHSSPAITLGYYAHFMPEAGSKGRGTIDGLLGKGGASACRPKLPRFSPAPSTGDSRLCARRQPSVDCKAEKMGGLGKCCKKSWRLAMSRPCVKAARSPASSRPTISVRTS